MALTCRSEDMLLEPQTDLRGEKPGVVKKIAGADGCIKSIVRLAVFGFNDYSPTTYRH